MSQTPQAKELTTLHTHHVIDYAFEENEEGYIAFTGTYFECHEFTVVNKEWPNTYEVKPS